MNNDKRKTEVIIKGNTKITYSKIGSGYKKRALVSKEESLSWTQVHDGPSAEALIERLDNLADGENESEIIQELCEYYGKKEEYCKKNQEEWNSLDRPTLDDIESKILKWLDKAGIPEEDLAPKPLIEDDVPLKNLLKTPQINTYIDLSEKYSHITGIFSAESCLDVIRLIRRALESNDYQRAFELAIDLTFRFSNFTYSINEGEIIRGRNNKRAAKLEDHEVEDAFKFRQGLLKQGFQGKKADPDTIVYIYNKYGEKLSLRALRDNFKRLGLKNN